MIIGKMFGSDKGNRDDFAIWHTCACIGLVIKIIMTVSMRTNVMIIPVTSMNTLELICSEQTQRGNVFMDFNEQSR